MTTIHNIPKAFTPTGGYGSTMPAPVLLGCTDPLHRDIPDLHGTWRVVNAVSNGEKLALTFPIWKHVERIEQAANRVVITGGGVVHDMITDGTFEHGVNDVMVADFTTPLVVSAVFEGSVLVLSPRDLPGVKVSRWLDGSHLMWQYHTLFTATLEPVQ